MRIKYTRDIHTYSEAKYRCMYTLVRYRLTTTTITTKSMRKYEYNSKLYDIYRHKDTYTHSENT